MLNNKIMKCPGCGKIKSKTKQCSNCGYTDGNSEKQAVIKDYEMNNYLISYIVYYTTNINGKVATSNSIYSQEIRAKSKRDCLEYIKQTYAKKGSEYQVFPIAVTLID